MAFIKFQQVLVGRGNVPLHGHGWTPRRVTRFNQSIGTSTQVARVETDQGEGFLKALNNPEGPHVLACEYVGSQLADWLGLHTLDFALIELSDDDEVPFLSGGQASPGPAFISRTEPTGAPWGGTESELRPISNSNEISGLVVLDTWVTNCDRYAPDGRRVNRDNVFLIQSAERKGEVTIIAMDFTHAFTCGGEITRRIGFIEKVQDTKIYGCFPEFRSFLAREPVRQYASRLEQFSRGDADRILAEVPPSWEIDRQGRSAWAMMITDRAHFVGANIEQMLWPQMDLQGGFL